MIKAILFDLDNTLLDFVKMKTTCLKTAIQAMNKAGLRMNQDKAYKTLIKIYSKTSYEDPIIFEKFLKKIKGKIDYKILSAAIVAYRKIVNDLLIPYPGVIETLRKLKNKKYKLGVVTDAPRTNAWIRLTSAGLSNYFDIVLTIADYRKKKPSKNAFDKAIKELKLAPNEILFVGDNLERDIKGANMIGMQTAHALYGSFLKGREKPTYTLKKFSDLTTILKKR